MDAIIPRIGASVTFYGIDVATKIIEYIEDSVAKKREPKDKIKA